MTASHAFARSMATPAGRALRIILGLALMTWGWSRSGQVSGLLLLIGGAIPFVAGAIDVCVIAYMLGAPASGRAARAIHRAVAGKT